MVVYAGQRVDDAAHPVHQRGMREREHRRAGKVGRDADAAADVALQQAIVEAIDRHGEDARAQHARHLPQERLPGMHPAVTHVVLPFGRREEPPHAQPEGGVAEPGEQAYGGFHARL